MKCSPLIIDVEWPRSFQGAAGNRALHEPRNPRKPRRLGHLPLRHNVYKLLGAMMAGGARSNAGLTRQVGSLRLVMRLSPSRAVVGACLAGFLFVCGASGDEPDKPDSDKPDEVAAQRLEFMLGAVRDLEATPDGSPAERWKTHPQPILRWTNPVAGIRDGIVAMWTDGTRPVILAQVFPTKDNVWIHEFQSLAPGPFVMRDGPHVIWEPRKAGETFHALTDAPPPADSATRRLAQMRTIAREFNAFDDFRIRYSDKETTRHELRLMANPVYRYEMPSRQVLDGAVFPYVLGTDPEVFVVIEAREKEDGSRSWEYLVAPL